MNDRQQRDDFLLALLLASIALNLICFLVKS